MLNRKLLLLGALAPFFAGCNSDLLHSKVKEGTIEYALTFPDYDPNGLMAGMLPEKTTLCFNETQQVAELSAGMGIFRTLMQLDNEGRTLDYHLSMMGKKIVAHLQPKDIPLFNADYGNATILYTPDVDTIAGYPCKKAVAIFDKMPQEEIELWYTDRIKMQDPNWFGPFAEIPGVLLRYEMLQNGIRMHLDAVSVTPGEVDPGKFRSKEEFQKVDAPVLHHELAEVLGTFSM